MRQFSPWVGRRWVVGLIATGIAVIVPAAAQDPRPADPPKAISTFKKAARIPKRDDSEVAMTGRVLLPDGTPAAGATVEWVGQFSTRHWHDHFAIPKPRWAEVAVPTRVLARADVGPDGSYAIAAEVDPAWLHGHAPVAWAPGFVPTVAPRLSRPGRWDATLAPAVRIEGRLLKPDGSPAPGVGVDLIQTQDQNLPGDSQGVDGICLDLATPEADRPRYWPKPRVTDADGRFTLDDAVGPRLNAILAIHHPDYAERRVQVATGPTKARPAPAPALFSVPIRTVAPLPPSFTLRLEPGRAIEGTITAKDTNEPIAGVEVAAGRTFDRVPWLVAVTDARGRYRIAGLPADPPAAAVGIWPLQAFPPAGSPYLSGGMISPAWPEGAASQKKDFALGRGQPYAGSVVDQQTRAPIVGAWVAYRPIGLDPADPARHGLRSDPVFTDASGRFAITGLAGPGVLLVQAPSEDYIRAKIDPGDWGANQPAYPHASARVDAATAAARPVELTLRKGVTLRARGFDPSGRALERLWAWCPEREYERFENLRWMRPFEDGVFELRGADPGRAYRVFIRGDDGGFGNNCGGVVLLKCDPTAAEPIAVTLGPTATIRGRVGKKDGMSLSGDAVTLNIGLAEDGRALRPEDLRDPGRLDPHLHGSWANQGQLPPAEFRFERLIPGVPYALTLERSTLFRPVVPPKPGEVIDLGRIVAEDAP